MAASYIPHYCHCTAVAAILPFILLVSQPSWPQFSHDGFIHCHLIYIQEYGIFNHIFKCKEVILFQMQKTSQGLKIS